MITILVASSLIWSYFFLLLPTISLFFFHSVHVSMLYSSLRMLAFMASTNLSGPFSPVSPTNALLPNPFISHMMLKTTTEIVNNSNLAYLKPFCQITKCTVLFFHMKDYMGD